MEGRFCSVNFRPVKSTLWTKAAREKLAEKKISLPIAKVRSLSLLLPTARPAYSAHDREASYTGNQYAYLCQVALHRYPQC